MARAHVVMGVLAHGECYGYALRRRLVDELGTEWTVDFGQLYRLLAVMRRRGWVRARRQSSGRGPARTVYVLTRRGRAELARWLADPRSRERGRDELPVKLHVARAVGDPHGADLIAQRRQALGAARDAAAGIEPRGDPARWAMREARCRQADAALAALDAWEVLVPGRGRRAAAAERALLAVGSDDPVVDLLARQLGERGAPIRFAAQPAGSLASLMAVAEHRAQLAGIHLLDVESGDYNLPFVKHLLPEEPVLLITLAHREQGLLVAPGNPKDIRHLRDLSRRGVRLVNRQRGAGTRLLLFHRLRRARLDPHAIAGYAREVPTHNGVAAAIAAGTADVGPGIRAAAVAWGLDFIPLGEERYDLVVPRAVLDSPALRALREVLEHDAFRRAAALPGYDLRDMGRVVASLH